VNTRPANWPYDKEKSKSWTVEETERVLEAICELPEKLWKKSEYRIYRMEKSKDGGNPATSAKGIVVLYDSAFNKSNNLARVIAHELAHETYVKLNEADSIDYRTTLNWFTSRRGNRSTIVSREDGFVTDDGRVSPEEDFANNIEYFLFEPNVLKSKTPHAFRWIKTHLGDKFKVGSCGI
jgi:hypothetical protein